MRRLSKQRRGRWELRVRIAALQMIGYAFLARWWVIPLLPFTIGFWLEVGDPSFPLALPIVMTVLTILMGFGIGRLHFRRLPFSRSSMPGDLREVPKDSPLGLLVRNVQESMDATPPDHVVVTEAATACLLSIIRRGRVRDRTLILGTMLTEALDVEQLRCVIAHELAHVRSSQLIDPTMNRGSGEWIELASGVAASGRTAPLLRRFLDVWTPKLVTTTIALAQADELVADRAAAAANGPAVMQQTLLRIRLLHEMYYEQSGWLDGVSSLSAQFGTWLVSPAGEDALRATLAGPDWELGDHPPLVTRIEALSSGTGLPTVITPIAHPAVESLGDPLLTEARERMTGLLVEGHRVSSGPSDILQGDELAWRAMSIAEEEPEQALELLERAVKGDDVKPWWFLELGRLEIGRGNVETGIDLLEETMRRDPLLTSPCCRDAAAALAATDTAAATGYTARADAEDELLEAFAAERGTVGIRDSFVQHDLEDDVTEMIGTALAYCRGCEGGWIAKKVLTVRPDVVPVYLLVVRPRQQPWWRLEHDDAHVRITEQLVAMLDVPPRIFVFGCKRSDRAWSTLTVGPWQAIPTAAIAETAGRVAA